MVQSYMEEDIVAGRRRQQRVMTVEASAGAVFIRVVRFDHGREFKWQGSLKDLIKRLEEINEKAR